MRTKEDKAKRAAYMRKWRADNREHNRKYMYDWHDKNRERRNAEQRERFAKNPEKYRTTYKKKHLEWKYGLTLEQFNEMVIEQNGRCAICKTDDPGVKGRGWHVDHDHNTGKVRGLLCHHCNHMLGGAKDRIETLLEAIKYLQFFQ